METWQRRDPCLLIPAHSFLNSRVWHWFILLVCRYGGSPLGRISVDTWIDSSSCLPFPSPNFFMSSWTIDCLLSLPGVQLAIPWGTSGMREEKKVLKNTHAVHMTDTLWGGTKTATIGPWPSEPSTAAPGSSLCLSASSSAWIDRAKLVLGFNI